MIAEPIVGGSAISVNPSGQMTIRSPALPSSPTLSGNEHTQGDEKASTVIDMSDFNKEEADSVEYVEERSLSAGSEEGLITPHDERTEGGRNSFKSLFTPRKRSRGRVAPMASGDAASTTPDNPTEGDKQPLMKTRLNKTATSNKLGVNLAVVRAAGKWQKRRKRHRFNYDKYIQYVDKYLPQVGFTIGGLIMTWSQVAGYALFLASAVAVFAQEAFFGDGFIGSCKNTVTRQVIYNLTKTTAAR